MPTPEKPDETDIAQVNRVLLIGQIRRAPLLRTLPSGDQVTSFSIRVDRPPRPGAPQGVGRQTGDTIECGVWTARLRRTVSRWGPGDIVEITGELRRTVRSGPNGVTSRYEVAASRATRLVAATAPQVRAATKGVTSRRAG